METSIQAVIYSKSSYRFDTIPNLLTTQAGRHANACALEVPSGQRLKYGELDQKVRGISRQLNAIGLGRRSRVAVVLPNGLDMSVMLLAVTSTSIAAPLNPAYREAEFQSYLNDIRADYVVVAESHGTSVRAIARKLGIPVIELASDGISLTSPDLVSRLRHTEASAPTDTAIEPAPDDLAVILLTSGSTGRSKRVPLTHRNICASVADVCHTLQLNDRDICLSMWEQFHIGGVTDLLLAPLASGGRIICTTGFDSEKFFQILREQSPTWFQGVPTTLHEIAAVAEKAQRNWAETSLRFIRATAAALSPQLMDRIERLFQIPVVQTFGMTEAAPLITTNPLPPGIRKAGSTGPSCGPLISVRGLDGRELQPYETGAIFVKGENVVTEYEGNKEATAESFRDGWFHTGDTGYLDSDGYLFLKGRIKEQINRGGEKIIPQEIDDVLATHPEIAQAVSFSIKHPTLGEDVGAAVVLRENSTLNAEGIRDFVANQLSEFKIPKTILFLESLPRSSIGKVKRDTLAALAVSQAEIVTYAAPETKLQDILAELWGKELDKTRVNIDDDFFSLGGDSLSSVRLLLAIETLLDTQLDSITLDQDITVRKLAKLIESLPDYKRVSDRIAQPNQNARFAQGRIEKLLSNIASGALSEDTQTPDSKEAMKVALMNCATEHEFDALLESFYTEMTPNELAPLAGVALSSAELSLPVKDRFLSAQKFLSETVCPIASNQNWRRQTLSKCIRLYTSSAAEARDKSLIVGFAGNLFRLMMPMWTFLTHLDARKTDLLFLWDPARKHYAGGVPELGSDFPGLIKSLAEIVSDLNYRQVIAFGTSAGGLPALCAGLANGWESIVAINAAYPLNAKHFLPMLSSAKHRPQVSKKQKIQLYYSELRQEDLLSTVAIAKMVNGSIRPLAGHDLHNVLWEAYRRGELPKLFSQFFV